MAGVKEDNQLTLFRRWARSPVSRERALFSSPWQDAEKGSSGPRSLTVAALIGAVRVSKRFPAFFVILLVIF
jgi:hypothetical protein